jgi:predicted DNA-binding transcriptional regulator
MLMVSKDQTIGGVIFLLCVIIGIIYVLTLFVPSWLEVFGVEVTANNVQFWVVAIPVFIGFIAIMGIGAWIGWTMATTPPPKPIEEIATETTEEKTETKTVEEQPSEPVTAEEEKKPERKRKTEKQP